MRDNQYDIFISYRRDGGDKYARTIQQALEKQFRVFLDFDELKDGIFDQRIIDAISNSSVFLLILSEGALDRCVNEGDWVRLEILHASKSRCHIVPVTIDDTFGDIPPNVPDDIRKIVSIHQFSELQMKTLFKPSIEQLIRDRIVPYVTKKSKDNVGTEIHIEPDCDCEMFQFKEFIGTLHSDDDFVFYLKPGKYRLSFVSCLYPDIRLDMTYSLESGKYSDIIDVLLNDKILERKRIEEEKKEEKRKSIRDICNKALAFFKANEFDDAFPLFQEAANKGDNIAQYYLGIFYEQGYSVKPNMEESLKWLEKSADAGNVDAIQYMSSLYEKGVYLNAQEVLKWLTHAISCNNSWAYYRLALMYYHGRGCTKDIDKAIEFLYVSADMGYLESQYMLGKLFEKGDVITCNFGEAYKWYHKAAERKQVDSQFALGTFYELGKGVSVNYEKAAKWYRMASEQGHLKAKFSLGRLYEMGKGLQQSYKDAISLYLESDIDSARLRLAFLYENGYGVSKNEFTATSLYESGLTDIDYLILIASDRGNPVAKNVLADYYFNNSNFSDAFGWYLKAAKLGYGRALFNVAFSYENGKGIVKDYKEAALWYKKAAEKGLSEAQEAIGYMYEHGLGLSVDYNRAIKWYRKAAKQDNINALFSLSRLYEMGRGVAQDYLEAARWFSRAEEVRISNSDFHESETGSFDNNAKMQYCIGEVYYYGDGVSKDFSKALKWYKKSADLGFPDAQFSLGIMYENGEGVSENIKEAAKFYYLSAKQGNQNAREAIVNLAELEDPNALYYLGDIYYNGYGVPKNFEKAFKWYEKAANMANTDAICCLGKIFDQGIGVQQDFAKASSWFRKAVELGRKDALKNMQDLALIRKSIDAQYNLGEMFFYGSGVKMDYNEATKWFRMAARQGYKPAISVLDELLTDKGY